LTGTPALPPVMMAVAAESMPEGSYWVDAHSHVWTRDTEGYPLAPGVELDSASAGFTVGSWTAEELLSEGAKCGIKRAVLIAHGPIYGFDNTYMTDSVKAYPKALRAVGTVDVDTLPGDEIETQMRTLLSQGVTGFRVDPGDGSSSSGRKKGDQSWLQSEGMERMWAVAALTNQAICCMVTPEDLDHVGEMCSRFPRTPVVIDHLGGIGENVCFGGSGIIEDWELDALLRLAVHERMYIKVSAFYAAGTGAPPYLDLVEAITRILHSFGAQRLMWATDCPYQVHPFPGVAPATIEDSLSLVRDRLGLTEEQKEWMLRRTAEKVFFFVDAGGVCGGGNMSSVPSL
jgi:predicted TIM-barrel fold metal-dependent hydrolase